MSVRDEPQIHSFESDRLPETHPWACRSVGCGHCQVMVHAFNNECLQPWVEKVSNDGQYRWALCMECFKEADCPTELKPFVAAAGVYPSELE